MKIMSKAVLVKSLKGLFTFFKTQLCLCGLGRAGMRARLVSWQAQCSEIFFEVVFLQGRRIEFLHGKPSKNITNEF